MASKIMCFTGKKGQMKKYDDVASRATSSGYISTSKDETPLLVVDHRSRAHKQQQQWQISSSHISSKHKDEPISVQCWRKNRPNESPIAEGSGPVPDTIETLSAPMDLSFHNSPRRIDATAIGYSTQLSNSLRLSTQTELFRQSSNSDLIKISPQRKCEPKSEEGEVPPLTDINLTAAFALTESHERNQIEDISHGSGNKMHASEASSRHTSYTVFTYDGNNTPETPEANTSALSQNYQEINRQYSYMSFGSATISEEDEIMRRSHSYQSGGNDDNINDFDERHAGPVDLDTIDGVPEGSNARISPSNILISTTLQSGDSSPEIRKRPDADDGEIQPPTLLIRKLANKSSTAVPSSFHKPRIVNKRASPPTFLEIDRLDAIVAAVEEKQRASPMFLDYSFSTQNRPSPELERGEEPRSFVEPLQNVSSIGLPQFTEEIRAPSLGTTRPLPLQRRLVSSDHTTHSNNKKPQEKGRPPLLSPNIRDSPPIRLRKELDVDALQRSKLSNTNPGSRSDRRPERIRTSGELLHNTIPPRPLHQSGSIISSTTVSSSKVASDLGAFPGQAEEERLSDLPSTVDATTKDRYMLACRILKSAMIDKKLSATLHEKDFLKQVLQDDFSSSEENPKQVVAPTKERLYEMESVVEKVLQKKEMQQLEKTYSDYSAFFKDDYGTPSVHTSEFAFDIDDNRSNSFAVQSIKYGSGPDILTSHPVFRTNDTAAVKSVISPLEADERSRTPTCSYTSSSLFTREDEYPFKILGIEDKLMPSVLTPVLMEALRGFFPYAVCEENFLLKYSLERDGDCMDTLLEKIKPCKHTILCIETVDGHVFGAFCSTPWRMQSTWYGSRESFLWRRKHSRMLTRGKPQSYTTLGDNEIEIYQCTGEDDMIQYCTKHTLAVGGARDWYNTRDGNPYENEPAGIGLMIDGDLKGGETNSCTTFANPRLGDRSTRKNEFDIQAFEVWTVTPCITVEDAKDMETHHMFRREVSEGR